MTIPCSPVVKLKDRAAKPQQQERCFPKWRSTQSYNHHLSTTTVAKSSKLVEEGLMKEVELIGYPLERTDYDTSYP